MCKHSCMRVLCIEFQVVFADCLHMIACINFEALYVSLKDYEYKHAFFTATILATDPPTRRFAGMWIHSFFLKFLSQFELWHKIALRLLCKH